MAVFILLKIIPRGIFYYFHTKQRGLSLLSILAIFWVLNKKSLENSRKTKNKPHHN